MHIAARRVAVIWGLCLLIAGPCSWAQQPLTDAEMERFLQTAEVGRRKRLPIGITGSERATLTSGSLTHDAHIQTINQRRDRFEGARGIELNFRDSFVFNVAAYRLDRLIRLNMVPVSVVRKVAGREASVTWWLDDVLMMELDRYKKKIKPPDPAAWNKQMDDVRVFNELVYNTDANLGNVLVTRDWDIRLVDFTRAFRRFETLRDQKNLTPHISRRVYEGLKSLDEQRLAEKLSDLLTKSEMGAILSRRDKILAHYDVLIAGRGERAVVRETP
jgi:hypothetical protein